MIRELIIKNYRGFKDFKINSFNQVNLIAGANNVGKTSLLEALYLNLAPSTLDQKKKIDLLRGFKNIPESIDFEPMWGWLFHEKRIKEIIKIISIDDAFRKRIIDLRESLTPPPLETGLRERLAEGTGYEREEYEVILDHSSPKVHFQKRPLFEREIPVGIIVSSRTRPNAEDAQLFSRVDDLGLKKELLMPLKVIEPRLLDMTVSVSTGIPMINCDIGMGQKIPLSQMGEGMVHFFSMISEIIYKSGGVVLVDEIDSGLHYSVMVDVWKAIASATDDSKTQIFATTHSFECISAAHKAFSENGRYDFRLHRLDRINDEIKAITYDREMLEAALLTDLEVR